MTFSTKGDGGKPFPFFNARRGPAIQEASPRLAFSGNTNRACHLPVMRGSPRADPAPPLGDRPILGRTCRIATIYAKTRRHGLRLCLSLNFHFRLEAEIQVCEKIICGRTPPVRGASKVLATWPGCGHKSGCRASPRHQKTADAFVAPFTGSSQPLFAARGILARRHAEPCREFASRAEQVWIGGGDRTGSHDANAWNRCQQSADSIAPMPLGEFRLDLRAFGQCIVRLRHDELKNRPRQLRQARDYPRLATIIRLSPPPVRLVRYFAPLP